MSNQQKGFKPRKIEASIELPNPGLRAYFKHVLNGQPDEYRTEFYPQKTVEEILAGWASTCETLASTWPTLLDFENDLRAKVGPMSVMKPLKDRIDDIRSYYDSILLESSPISEEAVAATVKWFGIKGTLRPRSKGRTLDNMKLSTNSGLPYFTKRRRVVEETKDSFAYLDGDQVKLVGIPNITQTAAVLGWRGQEGGPTSDDTKQRVVWMFPFTVNLQELQVYQPLIELCQRFNKVPAWVGMDMVDEEITKLFDTKGKNDLIICTDFSKFDQHFNKDMQNCARTILSQMMTSNEESATWLESTFPIKYDIPLMVQEGECFFGPHGMGSGSGGTNADETLVHRALQYEVALTHNKQLNPHSMCLGDDGILTYPGITVDDVVEAYSKHGQEMNTDKQYASTDDCVYLRRWHHNRYRVDGKCVGVYSTYRALGRLAEQERFYDGKTWSKEARALRQLSILENVKYHPLREEFVAYCMKGDKYRLGLDIPGFLDNLPSVAKKYTDLIPDFLGYTKTMQGVNIEDPSTGISSWWIVQYLKSLA
nr:MAG: putative RNA-dependent RNA polymerase [Picobirnavirus sp.]